jgi:predicted peptidase
MDNGSGDIGKFDGTSKYEAVLMNLIKNYVDTNPDIDKSKVIIGGCSNGGFMTLRMLFLNPDYFSAAYPICPPYTENLVTDEMIKTIKDIPMWFTFALNDNVVSPKLNEIPLLLKLSSVEAKDLRISVFSSVKDTSGLYKNKDGEAYEYNGHWSWIYTLNNEAVEKGLSLFEWAGNQTNPNVK